jgi:uncharacterized protein YggE
MRKTLIVVTSGVLLAVMALAQTAVPPGRGHIRAFGEATVSMKPDLAKLSVAVTTQAVTAQEASAQNAQITVEYETLN